VIDAREVKAESRADVITATISFHINDIRLVNTRTNISIEILPQDRASALRTQPYIGAFDLVGGFSIRMEPRSGKIDERMKEAGKPNPALRETGLEIFRRTRKHPWLDEKTLAGLHSSQPELDQAIGGGESALGKLCGLFYDPNGWFSSYKSCARDPKGYLSFVNTDFVRKVYQSKLARLPETAELSYSAGVNYSDFQSNDESSSRAQSYDLTSGVRLSVPLLDLIGLNIGTGVGVSDSWSASKTLTKGKSKAKNKSGSQSKELYVDQAEFNIQADVDRCLIVTEKSGAENGKVYMGCASRPEKKSVAETYYLIYQPTGASSLIDTGGSLEERPFLSLVRGTDRFQNFVKLLQDPEVTLNLSHSLPAPADVMREAEGRYDGFFPGLLTIEQ
jgi:hypothetical protein